MEHDNKLQVNYLARMYDENTYKEVFVEQEKPMPAASKYNRLLCKGLVNNGVDLDTVAVLPISKSNYKKKFFKGYSCESDGVRFNYISQLNVKFLNHLFLFVKSFFRVLRSKSSVLIYDYLCLSSSQGALLAAKIKKKKKICIVTDLPEFQSDNKRFIKYCNKALNKADGFTILTEQMNEKINPCNKPYIVLEGHSDGELKAVDESERYELSSGKKVVVYAGSLKKIYGIQNLVEGFIKADINDAELKIYGEGDYRKELEDICKNHKNVRYMGIRSNDEIVEDEKRAALLVNPRPSSPEYTKYSFPSKTMEYMVSGTPVLMTKLPGMPEEYYPFVYTIEDESCEGIANAILNVFGLPFAERNEKGQAARQFVLKEKSNNIQAKKILSLIKKILG